MGRIKKYSKHTARKKNLKRNKRHNRKDSLEEEVEEQIRNQKDALSVGKKKQIFKKEKARDIK